MKNTIIIILCLLPNLLWAQPSDLDNFFTNYSGKKGYTSIHITQYMFELLKESKSAAKDENFNEISEHFNSVKILTTDGDSVPSFKDELLSALPKTDYKEFMKITSGDEDINFIIYKKNEKIREFVMIISSENETTLVFLQGEFTFDQLYEFSGTLSIEGFEYIKKTEQK